MKGSTHPFSKESHVHGSNAEHIQLSLVTHGPTIKTKVLHRSQIEAVLRKLGATVQALTSDVPRLAVGIHNEGVRGLDLASLLGTAVRKARLRAGLTQIEIESRSGILRQNICAIELGRVTPTVITLLRLANAIGIRVSTLLETIDDAQK